MKSLKSVIQDYIQEIDPERLVTKKSSSIGIVSLLCPTKASEISCDLCEGNSAYHNVAWDAWVCLNPLCWKYIQTKTEYFVGQKIEFPLPKPPSLEEFGVPKILCKANISEWKQPEDRKVFFRNWVKNPRGFVLFAGAAGRGKSFGCAAILKEYILIGERSCRYVNIPQMYQLWRECSSNEGNLGSFKRSFCDPVLVVLDDLGQRTPTDSFLEFLYMIINFRYGEELGTLVTTNLKSPEMFEKFGEALTSRISSGEVMVFDGMDKRILKEF